MADYPNALWLMFVYLLCQRFLSTDGATLHEQLGPISFRCDLNITNANWTMTCESQDYVSGTSRKYFVVKLQGTLGLPSSPLTFNDLLNSTTFEGSEFHSCDSQWRHFLDYYASSLPFQCKKYKSLDLQQLVLILDETFVKSLIMSNVTQPDLVLNILYECSGLEDVSITDNAMLELSSLHFRVNNSVRSLSLRRDEIANITDGIFGILQNLSALDLSHNLLKHIQRELFEGTNSLSDLDVSHNLIESISSDAFSNLSLLRNISLRNNHLRHISGDLFRFNKHLSVVDLSNNDLQYLPATLFNNMSSLKNITCSNCSLFDWDKDMFRNSYNLVWMVFTHNHLRFLHVDMFRPLKFLEVVDLGNNNISYLDENLFPDQPYLMYLNLTCNDISFLKKGIFTGAPNIRYLDLSRNKIENLTDDHIKNFTDIEILRLQRNRLVKVELGVKARVKIRKLDISNNYLRELNVIWKGLVYMENFNADNNQLASVIAPPCIGSIKQTITFSFRHNNISRVNMDSLIGDEMRVKVDRTMTGCFFNGLAKNFVDLTHNPLLCDCELYPFYDYVRKKSPRKYQLEMFIDKGNLTCANPPFLRGKQLISLPDDLMSCPITKRCPEPCYCGTRGKDSIVFVNCSSRNLDEVPRTVPAGTYALYFNDNKLTSLSSLNTGVWEDISEIHLDNNQLTALDGWNFSSSLRYLSVRGNRLKSLPLPLMHFISNLTYFQLFFGNNDRNCECDREVMKKFLLQNIEFVGDKDDIICEVKSNGTSELLPLTSVPDSNLCPQFSKSGISGYQKSIILSVCASLTFLILLVLVLVYKSQREFIMSYLYIHCNYLYRLFAPEEDEDEKLFDAFVAYSSSDREIVLELLQELEDNPPYFRLCIHERNWLPGRFITDNIVNSVEGSRRTLVVLSNTFISSPWFNLEVRAAVFKASKDKSSKLIVILTDKSVSLDSIDSEIRHIIVKRTYLVWGERWFWEKLRYAMPRRKAVELALGSKQSDDSISQMALVPSLV